MKSSQGEQKSSGSRTNCWFSFQLQTECKPKHCWWKPPNTLFRNSSAHVLCFLSLLNDHNYEVICILKVPITIASGSFIKIRLAWQRSLQNLLSPVAYSSFQVLSTDQRWGKSDRWTPEKTASCFQVRFRSETKLTSTDPTSHEEQVAIPKATHEASFAGKTL